MTAPSGRTVELESGVIEAFSDGRFLRATGIPYARAGRGASPVPLTVALPQRSVACPQPRELDTEALLGFDPIASLPQDEDCLRLSVTAPADAAPGERLPVMVWVHGGGYRTGAGDSAVYDPSALVAEGRVVFVAVTYRLGAFGFLRTAAGQPANLGLLDVQEALRWVQRNITAFGGDPAAVTLFGQSSGADLIAKLMTLEEAPHLAARVILQSAPLGIAARPAGLDDALAAVGDDVLARVDAGDLDGGYALIDAAARPYGLAGLMPFSAEFGQAPLASEPQATAAALAQAARFDVLIGFTAEETRFFLPQLREADARLRWPVLGALLSRIVVRVTSRRVYERANRRYARALASAGARVTGYVLQASRGRGPIGAGHTIDLGLLFPLPGRTEQELHDGETMRAAWIEFARTGRIGPSEQRRRLLRNKVVG
jgi:para-nitrobenzyl esterase